MQYVKLFSIDESGAQNIGQKEEIKVYGNTERYFSSLWDLDFGGQ